MSPFLHWYRQRGEENSIGQQWWAIPLILFPLMLGRCGRQRHESRTPGTQHRTPPQVLDVRTCWGWRRRLRACTCGNLDLV